MRPCRALVLVVLALTACVDAGEPTRAGNDFSCVGATQHSSLPAAIKGRVIDESAGAAIAGAYVEIESGRFVIATATDADGWYTADLAHASATAALLQADTRRVSVPGFLDTYSYDPITENVVDTLLAPEDADHLYALAGLERDPTRGTILVVASDCAGQTVREATISVPGAQSVLYMRDDTRFDPTATRTSGDSAALVLNVPPGPVAITVSADEVTYELSTTSKPGALVTSRRQP